MAASSIIYWTSHSNHARSFKRLSRRNYISGKEPEKTLHSLLRCDFYFIYRLELLNDIYALNHSLKNISEENLLKVLLYGAEEFSFRINSEILKCTIKFVKKTDRFSGPLFLFYFFSPLTKHLIFFYVFYVQSMCRINIKRYMSYVSFVSCVVLFYYFYFQ